MSNSFKLWVTFVGLMVLLAIINLSQVRQSRKNVNQRINVLLNKFQIALYTLVAMMFAILNMEKMFYIYANYFFWVSLLLLILSFGYEMKDWNQGGKSSFISVFLSFVAVFVVSGLLAGIW